MSTTTYMLIPLPTPGVTNDFTGEQMMIAAVQNYIDGHDHSQGKGTPIHIAGFLVDADLTFAGFNATNLRTVRFSNQSSVPALLTDVACLAVSGGNLYYVNSSGQAVQITSGAALSATSLGGISGLSAPASAAFGSSTFSWRSGTNIAATMDGGPIIIRDVGVSALGITIASPAGLSAGYSITLPAALPGATVLLQMSSSGVLSASNTVTGSIANATSTPVSITPDTGIVAQSGLAYYKDATNHVHLRGALFNNTGGALANLVTTNPLPAGFRPSTSRSFACNQGANFYGISVVNTGTIVTSSGAGLPGGGTVFVDGITYLAEQ